MTVPISDPKAVFFEALEKSTPEELAAHLDKACGNDLQLRARVEELLTAHRRSGGFLKGSSTIGDTVDMGLESTRVGTRIGPYKLRQQIGEGGMGVVYLAEQSKPVKRRVALKIIKPGMDSRQVIARFDAERQALAIMDHPNIARVLDAGQTDAGRPYFVMELVRGVPITQYCDEQHLTPQKRLQLFIPVCLAVQHAHQKGVIHRDIKPGNILVTQIDGRPVPKVIDFGIAKATSQSLTDKSTFTQLGQIVGTLEYMSPEQANASRLDVDTRSDVYSLGVLLYELLTGSPPFERRRLQTAALEEILRIIREDEPPKPSTRLSDSDMLPSIAANRHVEPQRLTGVVRGELDWIVMKAIEKDRARRYQSANDFARDIQCHLDDEPILARPVSHRERATRWLRRNPVIAMATSVSVLVIVLVVGIAFWSITGSRDRAENARNKALELAQEKSDAVKREQKTSDRLRNALALADREQEKAVVAGREKEQAAKEAIAVRDFLVNNMISTAGPERTMGREITVRQMLDGAAVHVETAFPEQVRTQAAVRAAIGRAYLKLGLYEEAFAQFDAAHNSQKKLLGDDHPETLETAIQLGAALYRLHRYEEQRQLEEKTLPALVRLHGERSQQVLKQQEVIAMNLHGRKLYQEADELLEQVWKLEIDVLGPEHPDTLATMGNLALNRVYLGRLKEGDDLLRDLLDILKRTHEPDDPTVLNVKNSQAVSLDRQERFAEAEAIYREVLDASRRIRGKEHPLTLQVESNLASNLSRQGRGEERKQLYESQVETYRRIYGPRHPDTLIAANNAGMDLMKKGDYAVAKREFSDTAKIAEEVHGASHATTLQILENLSQCLVYLHELEEAEALLSRVLAAREADLGPENVLTLRVMVACVGLRLRLGRYKDTRPLCERAAKLCVQVLGPEDESSLVARNLLANVQMMHGEYATSSEEFAKLVEIIRHRNDDAPSRLLVMLYNLGTSLSKQREVAKAIQVHEEIAALQRRMLPAHNSAHAHVAEILRQLRQGDAGTMKLDTTMSVLKGLGKSKTTTKEEQPTAR